MGVWLFRRFRASTQGRGAKVMLDAFDSLDVMDMSELDFERRMPGWAGGVDAEATACDESAMWVSNVRRMDAGHNE
jgi:hypothetical protein